MLYVRLNIQVYGDCGVHACIVLEKYQLKLVGFK